LIRQTPTLARYIGGGALQAPAMAELYEEEAAHDNVRTPEPTTSPLTLGLLAKLKTGQLTPRVRTDFGPGAWKKRCELARLRRWVVVA